MKQHDSQSVYYDVALIDLLFNSLQACFIMQ